MSLQNYINEHLHINNDTKSLRVRPTTIDELRSIIKTELEQQGPDADLNHINTSEIKDMSELFYRINKKTPVGNIKIDKWDVSNVTDMESMFADCTKFNADLSKWDVSNVTGMQNMFISCENFNSDLSKWDTSNVTNMNQMFCDCSVFNSDLSGWDVSKLGGQHTNMFKNCPKMRPKLRPSWQSN